VFPDGNIADILKTLLRVGAVRRAGKAFFPATRSLVFKSPRQARLHILSDLIHFLSTARYNVTHAHGKRLQQSAFNPAVPLSLLPDVERELARAAVALLVTHDAALDQRARAANNAGATTGSGVGIYAYRALRWDLGKPASTPPRRSSRQKQSR
jgi:hypothetical protein